MHINNLSFDYFVIILNHFSTALALLSTNEINSSDELV